MANITLAKIQINDWTAVAQNILAKSNEHDISSDLEATVTIQAALDTTTAHIGTRFILQVASATSGNEDWSDWSLFTALKGTAATDLIEDNPLAAGSTSLTLTGHALTEEGIWILIEDGVLIDSELILVASQGANAVVALNGTANEHAQNTAVFNIAFSKTITLSASVGRIRLIVDNTYDDNGSSVNYKLRIIEATDIV